MEEESIWEGLKNVVVKIIIPALVGVSINLAYQARKKTMSIFNLITSVVIGIGVAWIASPLVFTTVAEEYRGALIAMIALGGDKFANYAITKFNIDRLLGLTLDFVTGFFRK